MKLTDSVLILALAAASASAQLFSKCPDQIFCNGSGHQKVINKAGEGTGGLKCYVDSAWTKGCDVGSSATVCFGGCIIPKQVNDYRLKCPSYIMCNGKQVKFDFTQETATASQCFGKDRSQSVTLLQGHPPIYAPGCN